MPIGNASLLEGATTYVVPTGGTAFNFNKLRNLDTGIEVRFDTDTGLVDRRSATFTYKDPVPSSSAPGGWTQAREKVFVKIPFTLDNGNRTVNTATIQISTDPEVTAAEKREILHLLTQLLGDSDFDDFYVLHDVT